MFENGIVVRHLNGNPLDNTFINIEIGTESENRMDIPIEKRRAQISHMLKSRKNQGLKYDYKEIQDYYLSNNSTYNKTMKIFGIKSHNTIGRILKGIKPRVVKINP